MALAAAIAAAAAAACALALAAFGDECMPGCGNAGYPGGCRAGGARSRRRSAAWAGTASRCPSSLVARATVPGATVPGSLPFGRAFGGGAG